MEHVFEALRALPPSLTPLVLLLIWLSSLPFLYLAHKDVKRGIRLLARVSKTQRLILEETKTLQATAQKDRAEINMLYPPGKFDAIHSAADTSAKISMANRETLGEIKEKLVSIETRIVTLGD